MDLFGTRVALYGLDKGDYNVVRIRNIDPRYLGIAEIINQTIMMSDECGGTLAIWAIDCDEDVYEACRESRKNRSVEARVEFKLVLESRGIRIV